MIVIATAKLNSTDTMFSYRGGRQEMAQWTMITKLEYHRLAP